ncbi:MAG: hypothetical protein EU539_01800 [Promethearchaeota archaeon]|nr:MAG: hypothetical protein EU539_01800 [Candidatus Lokiarchaeota archaeon]
MRKLEEIGICPNCDCSVSIFKTKNYKRFAKCEICGLSYPLPKRGKIANSALICPVRNLPILIIHNKNQKAYFWVDSPCFSCVEVDRCTEINELKKEFVELKVYGY